MECGLELSLEDSSSFRNTINMSPRSTTEWWWSWWWWKWLESRWWSLFTWSSGSWPARSKTSSSHVQQILSLKLLCLALQLHHLRSRGSWTIGLGAAGAAGVGGGGGPGPGHPGPHHHGKSLVVVHHGSRVHHHRVELIHSIEIILGAGSLATSSTAVAVVGAVGRWSCHSSEQLLLLHQSLVECSETGKIHTLETSKLRIELRVGAWGFTWRSVWRVVRIVVVASFWTLTGWVTTAITALIIRLVVLLVRAGGVGPW